MDEVLNTQWPKEKGQIKAKNTSQQTGDYLIAILLRNDTCF
jgi:hypothetical protein